MLPIDNDDTLAEFDQTRPHKSSRRWWRRKGFVPSKEHWAEVCQCKTSFSLRDVGHCHVPVTKARPNRNHRSKYQDYLLSIIKRLLHTSPLDNTTEQVVQETLRMLAVWSYFEGGSALSRYQSSPWPVPVAHGISSTIVIFIFDCSQHVIKASLSDITHQPHSYSFNPTS